MSNKKNAGIMKDWLLFLGELAKASVDGVVEFWGKDQEADTSAEEPIPAEYEEAYEDEAAEDWESELEEDSVERLTSKELKRLSKLEKKAEKQAKKEEKQTKKAEKKALKAEKKEEKQAAKLEKKTVAEEKKLQKSEEKAEQKLAKKQLKAGYVPKDVILSETEKKFFDGIKSAVGLRYIVKPRVALSDVLKKEDGSKCKNEKLGEMDFGVFDLQRHLKVFIEVRGIKRRGRQSKKVYRKVRKLCKKAGIPVVTFWAKYGVLTDYIKERMQDYLNII